MSGNLSLHAGYDVGYLTDAVGSGAVDYTCRPPVRPGTGPGYGWAAGPGILACLAR